MPNWTESMQQTFEYYIVNPNTWKDTKKLNFVKSSSIDRDEEIDTLGSMSIDMDENIGEAWIRVYLVTIQNGITERHPLGTFLVQTPSMSCDGKTKEYTADAYTPLLVLKETLPDIGYFVSDGTNVLDRVYDLTEQNTYNIPVVKTHSDITLVTNFIADPEDNWLKFLTDLLSNADYKFGLDEMGRILFLPNQDLEALQPVTTFDDGNSSILYPDVSLEDDIYGVPNVVEVVCSNGNAIIKAVEENNDQNSPVSIQNRGRRIVYRDTNPSIVGTATVDNGKLQEYAKKLLKQLSTVERKITFTHGYYPVRIGDCVRLNYSRAGLNDIKARIVSQKIDCVPGCPVTTTAVYPVKLWG